MSNWLSYWTEIFLLGIFNFLNYSLRRNDVRFSNPPVLLLQAAVLGKLKPVARKRSGGRIYGEGLYVSNLPHRTDR